MKVYAQTSGNYFFQPYISSAVLHMLALVSSALYVFNICFISLRFTIDMYTLILLIT